MPEETPKHIQNTVKKIKDKGKIPVFAVLSHPEDSTSFLLDVYSSYSKAQKYKNDVENPEIQIYQVEKEEETPQ
jgi:hypothetical protein